MQHPRMQTDGIRPPRLGSAERVASVDLSRVSPRGLDGFTENAINQAAIGPRHSFRVAPESRFRPSVLDPTGERTRLRPSAAMQSHRELLNYCGE